VDIENRDFSAQNFLLAALSKSDIALLAPSLVKTPLDQGATLYEVGAQMEHVYFPHSGMISMLAIMADGTAVETATVGREGFVGAMTGVGLNEANTRAVVQLPGTASKISARAFQNAVSRSASLQSLIIRYTEWLLIQVQYTAACNALHAVEARLCRWILQSRDRAESDQIPLTQELLAEMLGVSWTTVTLAARTLQDAGLIRYRPAKWRSSIASGSNKARASVTGSFATKARKFFRIRTTGAIERGRVQGWRLGVERVGGAIGMHPEGPHQTRRHAEGSVVRRASGLLGDRYTLLRSPRIHRRLRTGG